MAEKDVVSVGYLKDHERFADIINTYQFDGKRVVQASDIYERDPREDMPQIGSLGMERMRFEYGAATGNVSKRKSIVVTGDVSRSVNFQMKVAIVTVEQQSDIHYAMPVRVMVEDGANYHEQWSKIRREHKEKSDIRGEEYLSGFAKDDRLIPVYTIVLYWGRKPWMGPRSLKDMLDLEGVPSEVIDMIADYPINILEARKFEQYELFQTDLRLLFGFLQRDHDLKQLREFVEDNKQDFENLAEDTYDMISQFSNTKELDKNKAIYKNKEGALNMCLALENLKEEGRTEGREQGQLLERFNIIRKLSSNMNLEQIIDILKYEEGFVLKVLKLQAKYSEKTDEELVEMLN